MINTDILVTFVVDIKYKVKKYAKKYTKEKLNHKIDISIDLNIDREINRNGINAKFICSREPISAEKLDYQRIYITYETEHNNASFFVHKVKENILFIFKEYTNNKIFKIKSFELVNENINYDYYKDYWKDFKFISDSPRLK